MKASLIHIRSRIDHAGGDFNLLKDEMSAFFKQHGDPIGLGLKADKQPNSIGVFVMAIASNQLEWDRRVAHVLYDCRSALDQLVRQLYVASTRKVPPAKIGRTLEFPICTRRERWRDSLQRGRLHGIDAAYVKIIEQHQPYRRRRYTEHALAVLDRLFEGDKHRSPLILLYAGKTFRVGAEPVRGSCRVVGIEQLHDLGSPLKSGAKLARIHVRPTGASNPGVNVQCYGTFAPAFEQGLLVEDTINVVLAEVSNIVKRFEALPEFAAPPERRPRRRNLPVAMLRGLGPSAQLRLR